MFGVQAPAIVNRSGLVLAHQTTLTGHIGAEDSRRFTLELVLCHVPPPVEEEGLAKHRVKDANQKWNRTGEVWTDPRNKTRIWFRPGGMREILHVISAAIKYGNLG